MQMLFISHVFTAGQFASPNKRLMQINTEIKFRVTISLEKVFKREQ